MSFDPVDPKQSFPALEEGILQYWREEGIFKRSLKHRKDGEVYSFYDGPPFATGLPHYGHLLAGTIKDVIPRYQCMRGKYVERRFGWDCHGLPIENLIEQEHKITNKQEIERKGVKWFNDLCRSAVQRYTNEWRKVVERMGRWVDMDWDYRTMDPEYMESMWWALRELHGQGLMYEGFKPMHICPRCVTPLSNFEVTQAYADRTDMSTIATFPLVDDPKTILLAWTTTTWSLPGDLWLGLGKDIEYARVKQKGDDKTYIVSKKLVEDVFKDREHEIVGTVDPRTLDGKKYVPLFDYYAALPMPSTVEKGKPRTFGEAAFHILLHPEVQEEEGTGIVHFANTNAEDGYLIAKERGVDLLHYFGMDGCFHPEVRDFAGMQIKPLEGDPMATDKAIVEKLKKMGRLFKNFTYAHSYPHCWRCDSPLLNYCTSSWFIAVEKIKERMLANKDKTTWMPAHIRDGRFGKWLEGARDWAISRHRYWGTPLPIWRSSAGDLELIGGRDDLMQHHRIRFTKVTALRHAESEGNCIPVYQGIAPGTNLTSQGKEQATATALRLKNASVRVIYSSPLARARQTAEIIAKETGAEVHVDERLREVAFGEYEGKTVDFSDLAFVKERRAHKLEKGKPESIYHFEGMETWQSVHERITDFLHDVLPKHRSDHLVIVTHADPMQNIKHYFSKEDPVKISHQPYPTYANPYTFFWDHDTGEQLDLHKETVDGVLWQGSKSKESVELTVVRHGETDWNKEGKSQGSDADTDLNAAGRAQAEEMAKKQKGKKFDILVSSDLKRCKQTADILAKALKLDAMALWPVLRERKIGGWSGMSKEEIFRKYPAAIPGMREEDFHHATPHYHTPKEGESLSAFLHRAEEACEKLLKEFPGKKVLVVTHGGMTRAMKCVLENLSYAETALHEVSNADVQKFSLHPFLRRIPEVLDCWFESGSMPYSQSHFPFSDTEYFHEGEKKWKKRFPPGFPANFIAEGVDQTRAWFYVLMVLSTALFDETPYQNVVVNGIVLAEDGKKMSKRLKNYPEPMEVVHKYGADSIRFTLMSSPAVRAEDLRFSEKAVQENMRSVLLPFWNSYSFFVTYANAAKFRPAETRSTSNHPLDTWIRTEVQDLVNRMTEQLDRYDLSATCAELHETIDALTNWYVRLSRRRFAGKTSTHGDDQEDALYTLYDVLLTISQLLAPFCPYIADAIYLNLVEDDHGSIHLTDWPTVRKLTAEETKLLEKTRLQRLIVSLGLKVRAEKKIKMRCPLQKATVALPPASITLAEEDRQLIQQELNVKVLDFAEDPGALAMAIAQVDARKVGPRLGARVQDIIRAGKEGEFEQNEDGSILILDEVLSPEEASIVYRAKDESREIAADRGVVVSVDTTVTETLKKEGDAREIIRFIQQERKDDGLTFTDTIVLSITGADEVLSTHGNLIAEETRATLEENDGEEHVFELDGQNVSVRFKKQRV